MSPPDRAHNKDDPKQPTRFHVSKLEHLNLKGKAAKKQWPVLHSTRLTVQPKLVKMPIPQVPQWSISQPNSERVAAFLGAQKEQPFSYHEVSQTQGAPPRGYDYDDNEVQIGEGDADFARACEALMAWRMFPQNWITIIPMNDGAVVEGLTIAIRARALGLWWLNAGRVVYTVDEVAPVRRFGFAYGTLSAHVEQGEELFTIEQWADGTVWYRIQAFSRPNYWPVKLAHPLARALQRKFVRDSQAAMVNLMSG